MSYLDSQTRDRIHRLVNDLELSSLQAIEIISECQIVPVIGEYGLAHCVFRTDINLKIRKRWWFPSQNWVGFSECIFAENVSPREYRRVAREVEEEVSQLLYDSVRVRMTKSQSPREREYLDNFSNWFQFDPSRLSEICYQKEALLKLAFVASRLKECGLAINKNPQGSRESYEDAFTAFNRRLECLEYFNPEFTSSLPHWSELPTFIEKWLEGVELEASQ